MKIKGQRTFILALFGIILVPISWFIDWWMKRDLIKFAIEQGITNINTISSFFVQIPLGAVITLATFTASLYGARKAGREITTNLTLPIGQNSQTVESSNNQDEPPILSK